MGRLKIPEPQWVTSDDALREVCTRWKEQAYIAVDTEFVRTTTFYPKAGLIQVADSEGSVLIDPLEIVDWSPLADIFENPSTY